MENLKSNLSETFFNELKKGYHQYRIQKRISEIAIPDYIEWNQIFEYLMDNVNTADDYVFLGWFSIFISDKIERSADESFSFQQYEKAFQIDPTNMFSQFLIAYCTYFGKGTTKDLAHADELYERFSNSGNHLCQYTFATRLMHKNKHDYKLRVSFMFKSAAMKEHIAAMLFLGDRYTNGIGIERDLHKALFWYAKYLKNDQYIEPNRFLKWVSSQIKKQV
ncbi:5249_t:CDS:1 [Ambispora gerdemannii]|uniref:5249_t:CDS:1 n=1 Tax=Ambispora gerdemannii TaxID=144530 RepID=A0A9N9GYF7_9GLOM|nr:5249_t:CDS:1 [Ambispora gerdemannii]